MWNLVGAVRIAALGCLVVVGLLAGLVSGLLPRNFYLKLARLWHVLVTRAVGAECKFSGDHCHPGALIVCNHISWLDISVLGSRFPVVFLAKKEIASWPILGFVVKKAGTLFIERGRGISKAVQEISAALDSGQSVAVFPEGKTSDGKDVDRFQPRIFKTATDAAVPVQPIGLRYLDAQGQLTSLTSYAGNVNFIQSLWRTVSAKPFTVEIRVFGDLNSDSDRDWLSSNSEEMIRNWLKDLKRG